MTPAPSTANVVVISDDDEQEQGDGQGTRSSIRPTNNKSSAVNAHHTPSKTTLGQRLSRTVADSFADHSLGQRIVGPNMDQSRNERGSFSNHDSINGAPNKSTRKALNGPGSNIFPLASRLQSRSNDALISGTRIQSDHHNHNDLSKKAILQPVIINLVNSDLGNSYNGFQDGPAQHIQAAAPDASVRSLFPQRAGRSKITTTPRENLANSAPSVSLEAFTYNNIKINPKANLELRDGDFIRVFHIIREGATSEVELRGWRFRRAKAMNGMLEPKMNELCWILHVNEDDCRRHEIQGMESVSVTEVVRRRHICMTNRPFPELSFREHPNEPIETIYNERGLVCRFKYVCFYPDAAAREGTAWCEKALQRLRAEECDTSYTVPDEELRQMWRGDTIKGGASKDFLPEEEEFLELGSQCHDLIRNPKLPRGLVQTDDLPQDNSPFENYMGHGSVASLITDLELLQLPDVGKRKAPAGEIGGQLSGNMPVAKRQRVNEQVEHTKKNIVDLTLDERSQEPPILFATEDDSHSGARNIRSNPYSSVCEPSSEVVSIRAQIDTTSKQGTIRRVYSGTISTQFLSVNSQSQPVQSEDQDQALPTTDLLKTSSEQKHNESTLPVFLIGARSLKKPSRGKTTSSGPGVNRQRYTFGDCFCGAGGVSRGAVGAGLRVEWGFDFNLAACKSYHLNFFGARVYNVWCNRFTSLVDIDHKVDICHLSPPCQYFSDAHTIDGKDDEMNTASLFAIPELLQKTKPRVVTLEQTSGLLRRHPIFFNAVIHMFTSLGFSIRWKILNCADYGLPQKRKRLIIIASCPGEALPPLPLPTHTEHPPPSSSLQPWKTINAAIASIPPSYPNHNPAALAPLRRTPFDGNTQAACITTAGGNNICHPSGSRAFTLRELACLQGFPLEHRFGRHEVKKQIGNAVPPVLARVLLEEVRKALGRADGGFL